MKISATSDDEIQLQVVVSKAGVSFKEALSQVTGQ